MQVELILYWLQIMSLKNGQINKNKNPCYAKVNHGFMWLLDNKDALMI